jgi:hypothetical protein
MGFTATQVRLTAFYALTLVLVLILFKVITTQGETLKAPPVLTGQYRLQISDLVGCPLYQLDLQQSGAFLYGAIAPQPIGAHSPDPTARPARPTLEGRWRNSTLTLMGQVDSACLQGSLQLTAQPKVGDRLQGQLSVSGRSLAFIATRLAEPTKRGEH